MTSLDGINGRSIQTLLKGENDSKQLDEFQATVGYDAKGRRDTTRRGVLPVTLFPGGDFSRMVAFVPVNALLLQKSKHSLVRFEAWCALSFLSRDVGLDTLCDQVSPLVLARVISCIPNLG